MENNDNGDILPLPEAIHSATLLVSSSKKEEKKMKRKRGCPTSLHANMAGAAEGFPNLQAAFSHFYANPRMKVSLN